MSANLSHLGAAMREAEAARDAGMAEAENAADPRVILAIDAAIAKANASRKPWSANDIRDALPVSHRSLVGARVRAAAMRKPVEMVPVGEVRSNLGSTHAKKIIVWQGCPDGVEAA